MIQLTYEDNESYLKQKVCHICKKENFFDNDNSSEDMFIKYCRVRDHCHYTVEYRGAPHNVCNLSYKLLNKKNNSVS